MLLTIGVLSFIVGFTLMLLSGIFMLFDIFWNVVDAVFKVGIILMLAPILVGLIIIAFGLLIGLFGFTLLF